MNRMMARDEYLENEMPFPVEDNRDNEAIGILDDVRDTYSDLQAKLWTLYNIKPSRVLRSIMRQIDEVEDALNSLSY